MKKVKILIISFLVISLSACTPSKRYDTRSYVIGYYGIDNIRLRSIDATRNILIHYQGDNGLPKYTYWVDFQSQGNDKEKYDALCIKHNDMSYNKTVRIWNPGDIKRQYLGIDFISIDIVSDRDYDEGHPAGTSLNDITRFGNYSIRKFIDSGYKDTYNWNNMQGLSDFFIREFAQNRCLTDKNNELYGLCQRMHPVDKILNEIEPGDLSLLGLGTGGHPWIGTLHLESLPTLSQEHTFTVTLTADDGQVFTASITKTFE